MNSVINRGIRVVIYTLFELFGNGCFRKEEVEEWVAGSTYKELGYALCMT
jgi:hypothetical protein